MNSLEAVVERIYGQRLVKSSTQGNAHYIFSRYQDKNTLETYYLKIIELPTFLYISEATTELIARKYGSLVPSFQITPIDRNFQAYTYLVRSPMNILPLAAFIQIKKDCGEDLDIDFFFRFLQFAKNSFKILEKHALPLFSIGQIGITEGEQFVLCDPSCYFSGHESSTIKEQFGPWIAGVVREVLNLPLNAEEQQALLGQYFGEHLNAIRPFFDYLMSTEATVQLTESKLASTISRFSDEVSTVTGSFMDVNDLIERSLKGSTLHQEAKFRKISKCGKTIIVFVMVAILAGIGLFCFKFLTRSIQCSQGEYLNANNQCITCSTGCLRCEDSGANQCTKCDLNMYLVLADEEDKAGFCLSQCKGKMVRSGVCVSGAEQLSEASVVKTIGSITQKIKLGVA